MFIFSIVVTTKAQLPIIETNKTWNIASCIYMDDWTNCTTIFYKLGNAILIDEKTYTEILKSSIETPDIWTNIGYLREDGSGKSFFCPNTSTEEVLLYDFSLTSGDTVELSSIGYGQCCSSRTTIDSVKTINYQGVERKTLYISSTYLFGVENLGKTYSVWIEGIGSLYGLLQPTNCLYTGANLYVLCVNIDDQNIYKNPDESNCIISSIDEKEPQHKVQILETKDYVSITNNSGESITISFFNIEGKLQCLKYATQGALEYIPKSILSKGLYIISIKAKSFSFTDKLVIL